MKRTMKANSMVYPVPAALVSCADKEGNTNLITIAWTGTICSEPPMLYISVRPERYSYHMLKECGEFVLNLTTEDILQATDACGVTSGSTMDKWENTGLTPERADIVCAPLVKESPLNIECRIVEVKKLGTHDMFIAEVLTIHADESLFDERGKFDLNKAALVAYSNARYYKIGGELGTYGYTARKQ